MPAIALCPHACGIAGVSRELAPPDAFGQDRYPGSGSPPLILGMRIGGTKNPARGDREELGVDFTSDQCLPRIYIRARLGPTTIGTESRIKPCRHGIFGSDGRRPMIC